MITLKEAEKLASADKGTQILGYGPRLMSNPTAGNKDGTPIVPPDGSGCGSSTIAGINQLAYAAKEVYKPTPEQAAAWTARYIVPAINGRAIAVGHTNYVGVRDALLQVEGWKCGGEYYTGHLARETLEKSNKTPAGTLFVMMFSTHWTDRLGVGRKEAPQVKVIEDGPNKVVKRRTAKSPIATAVRKVTMAVVKTKRVVRKKIAV